MRNLPMSDRRKLFASTALGVTLAIATPAAAQQMGGFGSVQSVAGPVTITTNGNTLDVTANGGAIVNWNAFDVPTGSTASFRNGGGAQAPTVAILNRVTGPSGSRIDGAVSAERNVSLYMVNQNGVIFGAGAAVNVGSLVVASLDVTDTDFLDGDDKLHFTGNSTAPISSAPTAAINATGNLVYVAQKMTLAGSAKAEGDLALIATPDVIVEAAPNSPLKFTITRGSAEPLVLGTGNLTGRNVTVAAAAEAGAVGLLQLDGMVTATGMDVTDYGIAIVARDLYSNPSTTMYANVSGTVNATLKRASSNKALVALSRGDLSIFRGEAASDIYLDSESEIAANALHAGNIVNLHGVGEVSVDESTAKTFSLVSAAAASITGSILSDRIFIRGGGVFLHGGSGDGDRLAGVDVTLQADLGVIAAGEHLVVSGSREVEIKAAGAIDFDPSTKVVTAGLLALTAGANEMVRLGDVDARSFAGLENRLGSVSFGTVAIKDGLNIGTDGDFTAKSITTFGALNLRSAMLTLAGDVRADGDVAIDALALTGRRLNAGGDLKVATANAIALTDLTGRNIDLRATAGTIALETVTATGEVDVTGSDTVRVRGIRGGANVDVAGSTIRAIELIGAQRDLKLTATADWLNAGRLYAGGDADLSAAGAMVADAIDAANVKVKGLSIDFGDVRTGELTVRAGANEGIKMSGRVIADSVDMTGGYFFQGDQGSIDAQTLRGSLSAQFDAQGTNRIAQIDGLTASSLDLRNEAPNLSFSGTSIFTGNVNLRSAGGLELASGATLSGANIALSVGGTFVNQSGAAALSAAGRWAVYLKTPDGHAFGGLDSGNTAVWAGDAGSRPIEDLSGNRYVFALSPTLIFSSLDYSKSYGLDAGAPLLGAYQVTGLHAGIAGAFRGDTLASVVTGSPLLSSAGSAADATVRGGPYPIAISQGSLTSTGGYRLAFEGSGTLRVTPRVLGGTASVADKIYDGKLDANGSLTLSGILFDDDVVASGTFRYLDKNAGTGKAVALTDIVLSGADASNYALSMPASFFGSILRKQAVVSVAADSKVYDGGVAAAGRVTSISGLIDGDVVALASGDFAFADRNAGTAKNVILRGIGFSGADSGNYDFVVPSSTVADIYRKSIIANLAVDSRTYDGSTAATGRVLGASGIVAGDLVSIDGGAFAFADKNAGAARQVIVTGLALGGADRGNYELSVPTNLTADIYRKSVALGIVADSRTYDGTTAATGRITDAAGILAGDEVTIGGATLAFADKNAGTRKQVLVSSVTMSGADARNYEIITPTNLVADIYRRAATATVQVDGKVYDGGVAASGRVTAVDGLVSGDDFFLAGGVYAFADKHAGTGKQVSVAGLVASGTDAGNYDLIAPGTAMADIARRTVQVGVTVDDKVYDGTTTASGHVGSLYGVVAGDMVAAGGGVFAFYDRNAGENKRVRVNGVELRGADAGNYVLDAPAVAVATIFRRPVTVRADDARGTWLSGNAPLSYSVVDGALAEGDAFAGALHRQPGVIPGRYAIDQGSLSPGPNYDMRFVPGTYTVERTALPSALLPSNLYQQFELGGRATALRENAPAITWTATPPCEHGAIEACQ